MRLITHIGYGFPKGPPRGHQAYIKYGSKGSPVVHPRLPRVDPPRVHRGSSNGSPTVYQVCSKGPRYFQQLFYVFAMPSALDVAKRALVKLLRATASKHHTETSVSRESCDKDVAKAFRTVSLRAHPDKGGEKEAYQKLSAAYDSWQSLLKNKRDVGRPKESSEQERPKAAKPCQLACTRQRREFRVQSQAVLLTYQSFSADTVVALGVWSRFLQFVVAKAKTWEVKLWTSTAETNEDGKHHLHLMLQFLRVVDRPSRDFAFEGVLPNARCNDLLGEGFGGNRYQASVDRGQFYVWCNKEGTLVDSDGQVCRGGNCEPAWTKSVGSDLQGGVPKVYHYRVAAEWPRKLWQDFKLADRVYEEYLYLCRDKVAAHKRNFELCRSWQKERELERRIEERTKRIRGNPQLYTPFRRVPEADAWLALFNGDELRYTVLVVHAPSYAGKSEWAVSLFKKPLYVEVGASGLWPASMKKLDRDVHDGLVLDDVRDLKFLVDNQEKLQGKYNRPVELFTTPGGELSVTLDLFRLPIVFTINNSTRNLDFLETDDFCKKRENVTLLCFSGRPGECVPTDRLPARTETSL